MKWELSLGHQLRAEAEVQANLGHVGVPVPSQTLGVTPAHPP